MKIRPKLISKYLLGSIITPIITQNLTFPALKRLLKLGLRNYNNSYDTYYGDPNDSKSIDKIKETPISEGLMRSNTAVSEGLMRDNTAVSQVFDTPQTEINDIVLKNPFKINENPVEGKDQGKRNVPSVDDSKVIESYEKDPYDDLVLSEKTKENYENWLRSRHREPGKNNWESFKTRFSLFINNPDLWATGRLAVNLGYNDRIYDEYLKGLNPVLKLSYNTYRQVFGDEATKLGYYTRAALLLTRASRPFTSNAETSLAAMFDAYAKGNEMRAEGDRADNQRIRETSELANQHLDANRLRATEVANYNIASMALTKAQKHALLAQKLSAEGSSIDNWLLGIEYRKRLKNARLDAINDLIFALDEQERLSNDEDYLKAYNRWESWKNKHKTASGIVDSSHPDYLKEKKLYTNAVILRQRKSLRRMQAYKANGTTDFDDFIYAKSGTKITRKEKDDLLYKSAKDVVEHFRKMIALDKKSSKSKNKIERLAPHPKGDTRKYLLGGVAPFLVYKPIALGGETTTTTSSDTSSTRSNSSSGKSEDSSKDLMKLLFQLLQVEGLPSDTNAIYVAMNNLMERKELFGGEISSDDLSTMFIQLMSRVNTIKFNKSLFDKVSLNVYNKDAQSELAITPDGRVAVQDLDTLEVEYKRTSEIDPEKHMPLTNLLLLNMRAYDTKMAFDDGMVMMTVSNATSMKEIAEFLKAQLPSIESSESTIEGYTKKDTADIKSGIRQLILDAPEGVYEYSITLKTNLALVRKALEYLYKILPNNMRTLLDIKSGGHAKEFIATMLGAKEFVNGSVKAKAATGKAAKNADGSSKSSSGTNNSAGLAFVLGQGPRELISFNTGTGNEIEVLGIKGILLTKSNENLGLGATLQDATKSQQGGYLQWNKATFGGSRLIPSAYSHVILNDSTIIGMDLPFTEDRNGNEIPNFQLLKGMEEADKEIRKDNITDKTKINLIYIKYGLDPKYTKDGKLNLLKYKRFAAILVTLDEQSLLNKDAILSDEVAIAEGVERDLYRKIVLKSDEDYDLSDGYFGYWKDLLYKGTLFIPYSEDIAFAALSSGQSFDQDLPNDAESIYEMQYAPKVSQYVSPQITLSLLKNN